MLKRNRILLLSSSVVMLCLCLVIGATYALFTDSATVSSTHIQAGTLDVTLFRHYAAYTVLNSDGTLTTKTASADTTDFTTGNASNFFGLNGQTLNMVPGASASAVFTLGNNGTTAFNYTIAVVGDVTTDNTALSKQIAVTIYNCVENGGQYTRGTQIATGTLNSAIEIKDAMNAGGSKLMWIDVVFVDNGTNNEIRQDGKSIDFDISIYAIQKTE